VKKKILTLEIITILIIMILTLTGCGNKEENNNNKQNESNTEIGKLDLEVEELREFSEGLVAVKINGKWGYMDKKGNIVIDCLYESAGEFSEGLVAVQKDGKYGYINNNGDVVVDFKYRTANSFEFGYAVIRSGTYYGVIDKEGNEIIVPNKYMANITVVSDGLFFVDGAYTGANDGGYDIIDKNGNVIIDSIADGGKCSDGLIAVKQIAKDDTNPMKNGKWAYIDEKGNIVIDYIYDHVGPFVDEVAGVVKDGKIGYINKKGEYVIEAKYPYGDNTILRDYSCGIVRIYDTDKTIFFDKEGKEVFTIEPNVAMDFSDDMAKVEKNDKVGYINKKGELVIDYKYSHGFDFNDGLAKVYKDEFVNFEFIDKSGKAILAGKIVEKSNQQQTVINDKNSVDTTPAINNTNTENNNNSTTTPNTSKSIAPNGDPNITAEGIKLGNIFVKYGTYNGDAAVMGNTLIINSDATATLNGEKYNYSIGRRNISQDSSSSDMVDAIFFNGINSFYLYAEDNGKRLTQGSGVDYIYNGN